MHARQTHNMKRKAAECLDESSFDESSLDDLKKIRKINEFRAGRPGSEVQA